ncbi:MAG: outer membrane protein assembly factor BamE [Proteobacteria bacterium]|nr:outer membrane protein assembly factor BamE [Pseudomonadota bacterium]
MSRTFLVAGLAALSLLGGCAAWRQSEESFFARITPYRIEIVQGNVITSEQVARIKPGLTRAQVRDILGTPLLTDPFHADRWDYLFTLRRDGVPNQRRSVVVWFDGDALKSIEAPELPSEREFVAGITSTRKKIEPRTLELTDAQIKALPAPPKRDDAPAPEPQGPARSYPPLGD